MASSYRSSVVSFILTSLRSVYQDLDGPRLQVGFNLPGTKPEIILYAPSQRPIATEGGPYVDRKGLGIAVTSEEHGLGLF
jgi:hypothetical protein